MKENHIDVVISVDKDAFDRFKNDTMTDDDKVRLGISLYNGKPLVEWLKDYKRLLKQQSKTGLCKDCKFLYESNDFSW